MPTTILFLTFLSSSVIKRFTVTWFQGLLTQKTGCLRILNIVCWFSLSCLEFELAGLIFPDYECVTFRRLSLVESCSCWVLIRDRISVIPETCCYCSWYGAGAGHASVFEHNFVFDEAIIQLQSVFNSFYGQHGCFFLPPTILKCKLCQKCTFYLDKGDLLCKTWIVFNQPTLRWCWQRHTSA